MAAGDGLGPTLTGIAFATDAARNTLGEDPDGAAELLAGVRADTAEAITTIRALVYGMLPPALDEIGLVPGPRQQALADLTNVARHAPADGAEVRLGVTDRTLVIEVRNNGGPDTPWAPGVGIASMRERAAEHGGTLTYGPRPREGRNAPRSRLAGSGRGDGSIPG